ncbi:reverse transcriptase domain-containing protein [Sphingomonas sp. Ag1]|uniref:reverse transcriptase domain-containing protein n=1 Tax=Sphingomonas sp. Ag1 TaxID=1642949 RepID=UPI00069750EB|nr:reverse transcriptase domain-containing protein [Sphingomonas sp. Ag1]
MRNLYASKFKLPKGTQVFVPTDNGVAIGNDIVKQVAKRWRPPAFFYHLQSGGHVAAVRVHHAKPWLASVDLARFFNQVTRTRVHRALRRIGFDQGEAFTMASDSTVEEDVGSRRFSLPFGFVQSPLLASVAIEQSALGAAIRSLRKVGVEVTVYVDDITVSADNEADVRSALDTLHSGADLAGFHFNEAKQQGPAPEIEGFNIVFGSHTMRVSDKRFAEFEEAVLTGSEPQVEGVIGYVDSVNAGQAQTLVNMVPV